MKMRRAAVCTAGVAALAACASGGGGGEAPGAAGVRSGAASLPQIACSQGNLVATPQAATAQAALNRTLVVQGDARVPFYAQALQQSHAGIAADAQNPYHYFLAGQAYAGLDSLARAGEMFRRTVEVCPEFAAEVDPVVESAWGTVLGRGHERYQGGDTTGAVALWEAAGAFYARRADPFFNLGVVYAQQGELARAVENYRRALAVVDSTPEDTVQTVLQAEAEMRASALTGLLSAGAQIFQRDQFGEAAEVFRFLNTADPHNRDAWYNHALTLYKLERWRDLVPVARRLVQLDPLNYNAQIILFNAYKGISEAAKAQGNAALETENRNLALRTLETADALPVQVDGITLANGDESVRITGTVTGAAARAGSPVRLEFTATGPGGDLGTQTVTVTAPARDQTASFELTIPVPSPATSWRYRLVS
jgi:tetratricopeptide (TPR) repeat protein